MTTDLRSRPDEVQALRWLQRRLEWEQLLGALRDAGRGRDREPAPAPGEQEPAAA
jgi:hypothetical protein